MKDNKVRIADIADELGLSTATVSNVIHGKTKKISDRTVEMVQRKLEERQYIPNMAATLLAQNDSRIIGVMLNNHEKYAGRVLEDPFVASVLNDLANEIERAGLFMIVKLTDHIKEIVRFASMWNLDGMVIIGFCEDEYQRLRNQIRIPFVVYDGFFENRGRICNLTIDDYDGGRQVGEHFRQLGHQNVLCLADNKICMDLARYKGFCAGFGEEVPLWQIPMQTQARHAFYREHLEELRQFSAIFAVSDVYAVDVMQFLLRNGVSVPEEISVAGFDDSPICGQIFPSLTSVRQNNSLRARTTLEMLRAMKTDPAYQADRCLPVTLVPRESTAKYTKKTV